MITGDDAHHLERLLLPEAEYSLILRSVWWWLISVKKLICHSQPFSEQDDKLWLDFYLNPGQKVIDYLRNLFPRRPPAQCIVDSTNCILGSVSTHDVDPVHPAIMGTGSSVSVQWHPRASDRSWHVVAHFKVSRLSWARHEQIFR